MGDEEIENVDFDAGSSGASLSYPLQCSALRKNGFVVIKGFPCKVVDMSTSKTGKHGHAKVHLVGIDIFTGKKYEDICPSTHNMDVPNVKRTDYSVIDITDDDPPFLSLLTGDGTTKDDLRLPEGELGETIRKLWDEQKEILVSVIAAMGMEGVVAAKESSGK